MPQHMHLNSEYVLLGFKQKNLYYKYNPAM